MEKRIFLILVFISLGYNMVFGQAYDEKYRPQYHFSPAKGWIGDPDGLVYNNGIFHLYWWGHATSEDLVHWNEHPRPMKGDDGSFSYFSGSVVVDSENTAGFGKDAMIAFYTIHFPGDSLPETQGISVSTDNGMSYQYYDKNPVLDIGQVFFRDPQVFWYEPDGQWKMVVSRPDVQLIYIYESDNLLDWTYCSVFGGLGAVSAFWECPDLFEATDPATGIKKWVMLIGRGPNRVQYFIGEFDGNTFTPDKNIADYLQQNVQTPEGMPEYALWLDYGNDYYATRTWRNYDPSHSLGDTVYSIGWMGNWDYSRHVPTSWGKGFQSLPRTMSLNNTSDGYRIVQHPVEQLKQLRAEAYKGAQTIKLKHTKALKDKIFAENVYEMHVEFSNSSASSFGIELLKGEGRSLIFKYDPRQEIATLDRRNCTDFTSVPEFTEKFAVEMKAPVKLDADGKLKLHIFVDKSSVEIFLQDGTMVMSAATFPSEKQTGVELFTENGSVDVSIEAWRLNSIWR